MKAREVLAKPVFAQKTIVLVNPNPDKSFRSAYHSQIVDFPPLEPLELPKAAAMHFLYKAAQAQTNSEINHNDYRSEYLKRADSGKYADKMRANKYLDPNTGELCVSKWDLPPLVDLGTPKGQEWYEKGLALKEKMDAGEAMRNDALNPVNEHELVEPKENWSRDKLREYLKEKSVTYGPNEEAASLRRKAMANFHLLKETLEAANVKVVVL